MTFECKICDKKYKSYKTLWQHNNLFHANENIIIERTDNKIRNYTCDFCNKKFTTKQSKEIHVEKSCKSKNDKTILFEKQILELQKKIKSLESSEKNTITNNTTNNTNNGTINNIVVINKIGTENINDLNNIETNEIFNKKIESLIQFVKYLNFNERLPSNHNFCSTSLEGPYLQVYNTELSAQEKETKKYFFEDLLYRSVSKMEQLYNKSKNKFSKEKQKQIEDDILTLKTIRDRDMNDKLLKGLLGKLNLLSYNYKKTVINTWENGNVVGKKIRTFNEDLECLDKEDEGMCEIENVFNSSDTESTISSSDSDEEFDSNGFLQLKTTKNAKNIDL